MDTTTSVWPIRDQDRSVQVATHRYDHPETGRTIWLTGMIHIGDRAFYEQLRDDMVKAESDGVEIQYERVRPATQEETTSLEPGVLLALQYMRRYNSILLCEIADAANLSVQYVLNPPESWVNADITDVELLQLMGRDKARKAAKRLRLGARVISHSPKLLRRGVGKLFRLVMLTVFPDENAMERAAERGRAKGSSSVIVDHRNQVALSHLLDSDSTRVWASWGGGHVPGIHDGLVDAGYTVTDTTWRTAIAER